ncbi:MAG TPA: site-2 protease family protein [Candidatus Saccharimonadales bacterium]|nr:site-2 protease family protein [Candidatus Saccharimonadales bacterium]
MIDDLTGINIVYALITIVISLSIHEAMHAYAAHALGDTTAKDMGRLSLNPLKHIDPLTTVALPIITLILFKFPILAARPVPFNPNRVKYEEFGGAIVAAAGPLSNLVLAVIGALLMHVATNVAFFNFLTIFITLNVGIFIFNSIPIPPLDGSRVLYAFAPEPLQEFMQQIEPYGLFIVFALVLTGVLTSVLLRLDYDILRLLPLP